MESHTLKSVYFRCSIHALIMYATIDPLELQHIKGIAFELKRSQNAVDEFLVRNQSCTSNAKKIKQLSQLQAQLSNAIASVCGTESSYSFAFVGES
jgi:hypothetical protein